MYAAPHAESRLTLERPTRGRGEGMEHEVLRGLRSVPKSLPCKYFYDEYGAQLFDAICHTQEYYPTRSEHSVLRRVARELVAEAQAEHLVEFGSGAARKTRTLLDALVSQNSHPTFTPMDISEEMLLASSRQLLTDYPSLRIDAVITDYEQRMWVPSTSARRIVAYLGGSIGNYTRPEAIRFLSSVRACLAPGDTFVLGVDLVKDRGILHAAYNDAQGITAEFNLNVLRAVNRELQANFRIADFAHRAAYLPSTQQIEMYLRALRPTRVEIGAARHSFTFAAGEEIRTEISRKFTRQRANSLVAAAGFTPHGWHVSDDGYFALVVARHPG